MPIIKLVNIAIAYNIIKPAIMNSGCLVTIPVNMRENYIYTRLKQDSLMSKFFFKGRQDKRENHGSFGFSTNRTEKPGSDSHPISLTVTSEERKTEIEVTLKEHSLFANIEVIESAEENITALESLLNTPKTIVFDKTPNRNDPCFCGSGKKFKKCCGK